MKKTIAALILAAAVASPAMAQEFIESGLPTHVAPYSAFNSAGSQAYASTRPAASRHVVKQSSHSNVDPDANASLQQQNQNDIIDR